MRNRDQWTDADGAWLRNYTASEDYADLRDYYEGRGWGGATRASSPVLRVPCDVCRRHRAVSAINR